MVRSRLIDLLLFPAALFPATFSWEVVETNDRTSVNEFIPPCVLVVVFFLDLSSLRQGIQRVK
jgi:hypothetical protein